MKTASFDIVLLQTVFIVSPFPTRNLEYWFQGTHWILVSVLWKMMLKIQPHVLYLFMSTWFSSGPWKMPCQGYGCKYSLLFGL